MAAASDMFLTNARRLIGCQVLTDIPVGSGPLICVMKAPESAHQSLLTRICSGKWVHSWEDTENVPQTAKSTLPERQKRFDECSSIRMGNFWRLKGSWN